MKKRHDITIDHPLARITVIPHRAVPQSVCRKAIKSIEGVLNAALMLTEECSDQAILACVEDEEKD